MILKNSKLNVITMLFGAAFIFLSCGQKDIEEQVEETDEGITALKISDNQRYFETENGDPFFWLGDTGWLLFSKLDREQSEKYLEDRRQKGFNVIQVMVLHTTEALNVYGDTALVNGNVATPKIIEGTDMEQGQYDYWDHVDYVVNLAGEKGLYMALVPIWGSPVKAGQVTSSEAEIYSKFLAERYKDSKHVIWLNGGDINGADSTAVWQTIGHNLRELNPDHLITFHPRGRTQSSDWFHNEKWLDFNMIQSGHRRYDQDTSGKAYGEDNWKYVEVDYALKPTKPTLDAEPSYEGIPQGLHDPKEPLWDDAAVRRYGYWSVFAGAAGYTYGHSAVMQMHRSTDQSSAYGNNILWEEAMDAPGAKQMVHLKKLMLDFPYFERIPDQTLILNQGEKYDYLVATRGNDYALVYTYTGREIELQLGTFGGDTIEAEWFNPRTGAYLEIGKIENKGTHKFKPDGEVQDGNDWVLVLN